MSKYATRKLSDGRLRVTGPYRGQEQGIVIEQVAYHRNGVSGEGFWAVVFTDPEQAYAGRFLATIFGDEDPKGEFYNCSTAVISLDLAVQGDIGVKFGANSWRGDHYDAMLRVGVERWEYLREETEARESGRRPFHSRYFAGTNSG